MNNSWGNQSQGSTCSVWHAPILDTSLARCGISTGLASLFMINAIVQRSLAWGHPTNFSMWSGDIQYSKLYNLAEILLIFKSAKIYFKHHFSQFWHFWNLASFLLNCIQLAILDVSRPHIILKLVGWPQARLGSRAKICITIHFL